MTKRDLHQTLRIQAKIGVFIKKQQHTNKKYTKKQRSQFMTFPGFGLILGGQKSSKMETFWKRENVEFIL